MIWDGQLGPSVAIFNVWKTYDITGFRNVYSLIFATLSSNWPTHLIFALDVELGHQDEIIITYSFVHPPILWEIYNTQMVSSLLVDIHPTITITHITTIMWT